MSPMACIISRIITTFPLRRFSSTFVSLRFSRRLVSEIPSLSYYLVTSLYVRHSASSGCLANFRRRSSILSLASWFLIWTRICQDPLLVRLIVFLDLEVTPLRYKLRIYSRHWQMSIYTVSRKYPDIYRHFSWIR